MTSEIAENEPRAAAEPSRLRAGLAEQLVAAAGARGLALSGPGGLRIAVPRDRAGMFTPAVVPKHARRLPGFDEAVLIGPRMVREAAARLFSAVDAR